LLSNALQIQNKAYPHSKHTPLSVFSQYIEHQSVTKKPFKFKQKITTKDHVICIKLRDNLHEVTMQFDANSVVFCVKLQRMMNGIAHQERRNGATASVFPLLFLYLVQPRNVNNKQQSLQESRAFSRLHPRSTQ